MAAGRDRRRRSLGRHPRPGGEPFAARRYRGAYVTQPPMLYGWRDRDAAHRMHDGLSLHYAALTKGEIMLGRYVVIRLSDGHVYPTAYERHRDALRHAPGLESLFAYFRLPLELPPPQACDVLLWYVRTAYNNGYRPDPDNPDVALILDRSIIDGR